MAKKQWLLLAAFILLAGFYICAFTNWGRHPAMQISHAADLKPKRPLRPRAQAKAASGNTASIMFNLDHAYQLTEVKVVCLADWQSNKSTLPIWHLISDSNSVPIKRFFYGVQIRGMKPAVANIRPSPLQTNVLYRLFLTAGATKGEHDFSPPPK